MKKLSLLSITLTALVTSSLFAQPDTLWTKTYGGIYADGAKEIIETSDNGFAIVGYTFNGSAGMADICLLKTDADGNLEWSNTFGGASNDYGYSLCQTADGGYAIVGYTASYGAGSKDVWLIRIDENGDEVWSQTYGGEGVDVGKSVCRTDENHFLICGYTESTGAGEDDVYVIKTDADGNEIWSQTYGGTASEMGHCIKQVSDGNYVLYGSTGTYGSGNRDAYMIKIDPDGNVIWFHAYSSGGPYAYYIFDRGNSFWELDDNGFAMIGSGDVTNSEAHDFFIVKTNASGNMYWQTKLGATNFYDFGFSIFQAEGGYISAGATKNPVDRDTDAYLIKTSENGVQLWNYLIGGEESDWVESIIPVSDGNFIVAGQTKSYGAGSFDIWLLKMQDEEVAVKDIQPEPVPEKFGFLRNYPNPFNPETELEFNLPSGNKVTIVVYDVTGRQTASIVNDWYPAGRHSVAFKANDNLAGGIYFAVLKTEEFKSVLKILLLK